jgi:flagellar hook-associated protein 3 FlgL
MIKSLSSSAEQFLNNLARINTRQSRAQRQLGSGLKIERPSDAPDQVSLLLEIRARLATATQTKSNLGAVKTEVDMAESSLSQSVSLVERVRTLGAQGLTETQTAQGRATIAGQLDDVLKELVGIANTSSAGRYVFSGNSDQTQPYSIDTTQAYPVSVYQGSAATRQIMTARGDTFAVALSADQIFDDPDPTKSVFQAVNGLSVALKANDTSAIRTAMANVGTALDHLNQSQAVYGGFQNRVAEATDEATNLESQLQVQVSGLQDADLTAAIIDLQQANLQQQAALSARMQSSTKSLFDYLG